MMVYLCWYATERSIARTVGVLSIFIAVLASMTLWSRSADAIPAFARKYGTSCLTCHTVYPKLNPFGEAFRRNGFRFPGVDSDAVKEGTVALGQESQKEMFPKAAWPSTLPVSVPLAIGFNGEALVHPDRNSSAAVADHKASFTMNDLIAEGHLWAGGSFDDSFTFFGELTFSDTVEIEHAIVLFNDLVGPKHLLNLTVGRTMSTISSFGPHSSYVADMAITPLSVSALYGTTDPSWSVGNSFNGAELTSIIAGRINLSTGVNAGSQPDVRVSDNAYGHIGAKLGGMRLDGEGWSGPPDPMRPWEERALTVDGFVYWSDSHFNLTDQTLTPPAPVLIRDRALTFGGSLRAQWDSLEIDSGVYEERHRHVLLDGSRVKALAQYNEVSYVVFPWLVPAVRVEYLRLRADAQPVIHDVRVIPGVAILIRANLKVGLIAQYEQAKGAPDAGWSASGGFAAPAPGRSVSEIESIMGTLAFSM